MSQAEAAAESRKPPHVSSVFLASPYPLSRITGIGRFVRDLSRFLEQAGVRVHVAHPATGLGPPAPTNEGIILRWKAFPSLELALETARMQIRSRSAFQVVHVQQPHLQSVVAVFVGRVLGKPSVLTLHLIPPIAGGRLRRLAHRFISNLSLRTATLSVAVSPCLTETLRSPRLRIIENGVDTRFFHYSAEGRQRARASLGIGSETAFVFVGRWTVTKGVDVLLRAADSDLLNGLSFRLILVGEPAPDEPGLVERLVARMAHPSRIVLAGSIPDGQLPEFLSAGDVFVTPSLYEGMPLAFLEAMAMGLPPLASDIPVHRLLVERSGVGWLFRSGAQDQLTHAMAKIIEQGIPRHWPEQARASIARYHDIRSKVAEYLEAYDGVRAGVLPSGDQLAASASTIRSIFTKRSG